MRPPTTISRLRASLKAPERVLERRLLAGLSSPILVLWVAISAFVALSRISASTCLVEQSADVMATLREAQLVLLDAEVGRDDARGAAAAPAVVHRLRALTAAD